MSKRRIDYDKVPEEFKHLSKIDQSKLMYQAESMASKIKSLSPEASNNLTRKMTQLGQNEAQLVDFMKMFDTIIQEDSEKRAEVRKKNRKKVEVVSVSCKCDFLPKHLQKRCKEEEKCSVSSKKVTRDV